MCSLNAQGGNKHGHLNEPSFLERLFNRVTSHFFYLGELDDEKCRWTNKKVTRVLLISAVIPATFRCCLVTSSR